MEKEIIVKEQNLYLSAKELEESVGLRDEMVGWDNQFGQDGLDRNLDVVIGKPFEKHYALRPNLEVTYREMVLDEKREREANNWSEEVIGNVSHTE